MSYPFILGKKTVLRPVELSDVPNMTRWINDPETRKYLTVTFPLSEMAEKAYVEKRGTLSEWPTEVLFIIEAEQKPIGTMGLHCIDWIDRNTVTGTIIGEKECRGKGYAMDAKMALLKYAFETLGMHKIMSRAFAQNEASIAYSKRCGYKVEGMLKESTFRNGEWWDTVQLACFHKDWQEAYAKYE